MCIQISYEPAFTIFLNHYENKKAVKTARLL